jgi:lysophospholipase L1-like esterase
MKKNLVVRTLLALCAAGAGWAQAGGSDSSPSWVATWGAPPIAAGSALTPGRSLENVTVRHVVRVSAGGRKVRVRLSNAFGAAPLKIAAAHVALHAEDASIVPGSDRTLRFGGKTSITVPTASVALSDPIDFFVPTRGDLAVSVYVADNTGPATFHESAGQTTYISEPGDFAGAIDFPTAETTIARFFLTVVEVQPFDRVPVVVALGDSITGGFGSTVDANRRWPDLLSARLNVRHGATRLAVVNQGIGCSRLLWDFCGPNGSGRFDRDVLAASGVTHVIVALGLNDIGLPTVANIPSQIVSADEIIAGLKQLAERAHDQGLAAIGATLTPIGSSIFPGYFTPENEVKRQAVNHWIRTNHTFDGFIDFDRALRDPAAPVQLRPAYNSGDGVHPSDAGYQAMANAVDLSLLF